MQYSDMKQSGTAPGAVDRDGERSFLLLLVKNLLFWGSCAVSVAVIGSILLAVF